MIAYLDTSALLRLVLREPGSLSELRSAETLVSSELLAVESLRTIDRLRISGALSASEASARRVMVAEWLEAVDLVLIQRAVLSRASEPFPTPLGTLDALHLGTALVWRDRTGQNGAGARLRWHRRVGAGFIDDRPLLIRGTRRR